MRELSFVAVLALAGCATVTPTQLPTSAPAPAAELVPIPASGAYTHPQTRLTFPAVAASFERVSLFKRDAAADRITVGYAGGTPQCLAAITFWIDPATEIPPVPPELPEPMVLAGDRTRLADAFKLAQAEVLKTHPEAVEEAGLSAGMLEGMPAQRFLYRVDDRLLELSEFLMGHAWYVKYWVIYPSHCTAEAKPRVSQFFETWRSGSR